MEGSNVWGDSPLAPETNSASVIFNSSYSNSGTEPNTNYPNPYNTFSNDETVEGINNDDDLNADENEDKDKISRSENEGIHDWKENGTQSSNIDNIDEFKIQNELAHTMKSILLTEDHDENNFSDEGEYYNGTNNSNNTEQYDQTDHVHYVDNNIHRKSDIGNPFLASSIQDNTSDDINRYDINILKEKKNELISSLTKDSSTNHFLEDNETDDNKVQQDNLFEISPIKNAPNNGVDDSPLNNLLSLAGTSNIDSSESSTVSTSQNETSSLAKAKTVVSPNRKVKMLRPRRVTKSSLRSEPVSSSTKTVASSLLSSTLDPLSAPLQSNNDNSNSIDVISLSPGTRKQKLINESDAPLFNVNRDQVLEVNRQTLSPVSSNFVAENSSISSKYKPEDEEKGIKFDITVGDPIKVKELTDTHVVYTITTKTKCELLEHEDTTVTRRYSDFLWLYHQLLNNHPGYIIPPPPEKQIYGRFDEKFIENRRLALENMLTRIAQRKILQTDVDFIVFLQSGNFTEESKERETIVYNNINTLETINSDELSNSPMNTMSQILNATESLGISESSSSGGFFSSLIGLNVSKYTEEDPYILEKQSYVESLDVQLRQLTQSLDMILEKRDELNLSLQDVTTVIQQMVDLEVNVEITDSLNNFAELQSKIREILERANLSQILTFGSTVDEYVRLIGSIRNCFDNRLKICNSVTTLKQHQEKKEHSLAKFRSKNQNAPDKIKRYEDDLSRVNNVLDKQLKFKEEFDKTFKSELSRFEFSKIKDFKNMIEIYWESLIENQKILIELWESFYDKCKFD